MKCYVGSIITVNENDDVFGYLVEDHGKILYVGNQLPKEYEQAERIELGDKALIPSFVDTHQHLASFSTFQAGLNVMDAETNIELASMIQKFVNHGFTRPDATGGSRIAAQRGSEQQTALLAVHW